MFSTGTPQLKRPKLRTNFYARRLVLMKFSLVLALLVLLYRVGSGNYNYNCQPGSCRFQFLKFTAKSDMVSTEPVSPDSALFQEDIKIYSSICKSTKWIDMPIHFWNLIYVTKESSMSSKCLDTFLSPLSPKLTTKKRIQGVDHISFIRENLHRIEILQSGNASIILPGWCSKHPYPSNDCSWPSYTSAFLTKGNVCFWPVVPKELQMDQIPPNFTSWAQKFTYPSKSVKKAMVAGGFLDNFWHAAAIFNSWCNIRNQEDVLFLIQTEEMPSFVLDMASALGINKARVIHHTGPVLAESILLAPYHMAGVDWSCLHQVLSDESRMEKKFLIIYFRGWDDISRNIPESIHEELVLTLSKSFPNLEVKTFSGNESFADTLSLFQGARIVIGPHGAGMVNLIFCEEGTPVIELTTESLIDRPWQAMGAQTFGIKWWPVLLDNFTSRGQILGITSIVENALRLS